MPKSKHSVTKGMKNSLLTGRNLQHNQVQGGVAIHCNLLEVSGRRREKVVYKYTKIQKR